MDELLQQLFSAAQDNPTGCICIILATLLAAWLGYKNNKEGSRLPCWLLYIACFAAFSITGCQASPNGSQRSVSGLGFFTDPSVGIVAVGSFVYQAADPLPAEAGPGLMRTQITAPGTKHSVTQASGPVGQEFERADGTLVEVVRAMHQPGEE